MNKKGVTFADCLNFNELCLCKSKLGLGHRGSFFEPFPCISQFVMHSLWEIKNNFVFKG